MYGIHCVDITCKGLRVNYTNIIIECASCTIIILSILKLERVYWECIERIYIQWNISSANTGVSVCSLKVVALAKIGLVCSYFCAKSLFVCIKTDLSDIT